MPKISIPTDEIMELNVCGKSGLASHIIRPIIFKYHSSLYRQLPSPKTRFRIPQRYILPHESTTPHFTQLPHPLLLLTFFPRLSFFQKDVYTRVFMLFNTESASSADIKPF